MKTVDKCVIQAAKKKMEMVEVLSIPEDMGIRGKQSDSLITFYNIIKNYISIYIYYSNK